MQESLTSSGIQRSSISLWQVVMLTTISLMLLYVVGFSQSHELHELFHDLRHAIGFACH